MFSQRCHYLVARNLSQNDLNNKMNKLHLLESDPEKIDFYSDIDKNTNLDIDFKYYDQIDFIQQFNKNY